ncbi:hypothetical protein JXD20_00850 [Candidatus Peregrinibacteria bacterium]|nr:hypothetical protein [Candidatus Peregrinibacteria bacterium]
MNLAPAVQTLAEMERLYKSTMELYESYFEMLKVAAQNTPDSEVNKMALLNQLVEEATEALQTDLNSFEKAIATDAESLAGLKDQLKIQDIYKKLQK